MDKAKVIRTKGRAGRLVILKPFGSGSSGCQVFLGFFSKTPLKRKMQFVPPRLNLNLHCQI